MLQWAREKCVYRNLICADLTVRLALIDAGYDVAICVGSMGTGHVGAQHVAELLQPVKSSSLFVVINAMYYTAEGFERAFGQMESDALWRIHRRELFNYMSQLDRPGWLLLAEKLQNR